MTPEGQSEQASGVADADAVAKATATIEAAGCDHPREDAEALVAFAGESGAELDALVARRAEHEPLAYILGHERFRGIDVGVDSRVLIPRRETGLLVEVALELPEGSRVHEVGTGSAAVALAILDERPDLTVTASDLSPEAAEVARENAEKLGAALEVTVDEGLPEGFEEQEIDLVVANMPYVTDSTIYDRDPEIQREPRIAVTGDCGEDGLGVIRRVLSEIPSGWQVAFEHDTHHGPTMREMLEEARTLTDYMGGERVTVGRVP